MLPSSQSALKQANGAGCCCPALLTSQTITSEPPQNSESKTSVRQGPRCRRTWKQSEIFWLKQINHNLPPRALFCHCQGKTGGTWQRFHTKPQWSSSAGQGFLQGHAAACSVVPNNFKDLLFKHKKVQDYQNITKVLYPKQACEVTDASGTAFFRRKGARIEARYP